MRLTQRKWIEQQLRENGEITRNQCLQNYIARLAPRIEDLEKDGWVFAPEHREGDYVYKLVSAPDLPVKPVTYVRHPLTGERISTTDYAML